MITTSNRKKLPEEFLPLPDNIEIIEIPTHDYRLLLARKSVGGHLPEERKKHFLFRVFGKLQKTLPFHFILGEGGWLYIRQAVKRGREIVDKNPVELIYSSFGPYADHLIASRIKGCDSPVKWIADFRDLQIEPLYNNVYFRKWQITMERKILRNADLITTVSEGLRAHLQRYERPSLSVGRGVSLRPKMKHFDKFSICYTGSLYQTFRDADYFFSALSALIKEKAIDPSDFRFMYAGRDGHRFDAWIRKYELEEIYENLGFLSREDTLEVQNRSHLQLLLTSATEDWGGVLTGKFFEYLESSNPILVLIKGVKDPEFEAMMHSTGAGIVCYDPPEDSSRLPGYILNEYSNWKRGIFTSAINRDFVDRELSWSRQMDRILYSVLAES